MEEPLHSYSELDRAIKVIEEMERKPFNKLTENEQKEMAILQKHINDFLIKNATDEF